MAYTELLENEVVTSNYLAVLRPRIRVDSFSLFSGAVYSTSFTRGHVARVFEDGQELTSNTSTSLVSGEFYFDYETSILYVRTSGDTNPNSLWLIVSFEVYAATTDAHTYRIPTDDTQRVVYFEPIIQKSPILKQYSSDSLFGFNPIQTSSISLINVDFIFDPILHEGTFNKSECFIYHWLGETLDTDNISLVFAGFVDQISLNQPIVNLRLTDRIDLFQNEFRHTDGSDNFYLTSVHAQLDSKFEGSAVRKVFGRVSGFTPVNITYVDESPTTSDNRTWSVVGGIDGIAEISRTVSASPSSTTTRTYLDDTSGLNILDTILIDKASDESTIIRVVTATYIEHDPLSVAANSGDTVKRGFVSSITIVQQDVEYTALYSRDYTISIGLPGNKSGFVFSTSLESNLGMPDTLGPFDQVFCTVYGQTNNQTLGGPAYGTNDSRTSNMCHPSQLLLYILKNTLLVNESDIHTSSFTSALTDQSSGVGIAIPASASSKSFPKLNEILGLLTKSALFSLIINEVGKFSINTTKPLVAASKELSDDEILNGSISFSFDYSNLNSDFVVEYAKQEQTIIAGESVSLSVTSTSDVAKYLHGVNKTMNSESVWMYEQEAQELADRLSYYFGDRIAEVTLRVKNRFYDSKIGDVINLQRAQLPGYLIDSDTIRDRDYIINTIEKGRTQITITFDDFKGIEDNSGGW